MATLAPTTTSHDQTTTARRALLLDAAASGASGLLATAGAGLLAEPLGIPTGWLLGLGIFMLLYAADLWLTARALPRSLRHVRLFGFGNLGWVAASVAVVAFGAWSLTGLGVTVVLLQAAAVAGFAVMQIRASA